MTTLYLIRHGATEANLKRPYVLQGQGIDMPLAELGVKQAQRVAELMRPLGPTAIYASPLQRARQTAESIAESQPVRIQPDLTEGNVGRWEGRSYEQIEKEDAEAYRLFQLDPARNGYPGGETFGQILSRTAAAFAQIAASHAGEAVAVVTHQIVCRVYLASLLGLTPAQARKLKTANGGVSVVTFENGAASVATLNAAFHLVGVATPP